MGISVFSGEGLGELAACLGKLAAENDRRDDRDREWIGALEAGDSGNYREA
jgi:hypothetical protein